MTSTLKETMRWYKSSFKICFILSLALSVITEYFKAYAIHLGLYDALKQYFESGDIPQQFQHNTLLGALGILSIVTTIVVYGLLVCIAGMQLQKQAVATTKADIYQAINIFRARFWPFLGAFFISVILWGLAGFLGIIGIWLVTSFSLIIFPVVLLSNVGVFLGYKKTFSLMARNSVYALQMGFITIILLGIKYLVYFIFITINDYNNIHLGIEHVVMVFTEAVTLPFITMLMVSVYHHLAVDNAVSLTDKTSEHQ